MKGLIIAAGYGTRFLPFTKTVPKEMLPLIDRPSIDFIVDEFIRSGIEDIIVITSRRKKVLEDYLDREIELESIFTREGADEKLQKIQPPKANFIFIRQTRMMGTGHALMTAMPAIGNEPCVVAYPDDLHMGNVPLAKQLITRYEKTGGSVMAAMYNPPHLERYGVLSVDEQTGSVKDIVEKPAPGTEPGKEASIGRYLYTPEFFSLVKEGWEKHLAAGNKGEYYHTYALKALMKEGKVFSHRIEGARLDTGEPEGYLRALVQYAAKDPELKKVIEEELAANDTE